MQCAQLWQGELREEVFGTGTLEAKVVIGFSAKIIGKVVEVLVESRYHHRLSGFRNALVTRVVWLVMRHPWPCQTAIGKSEDFLSLLYAAQMLESE